MDYQVDPTDRAVGDLIADNLGSLPFPGEGKRPPYLAFLPGYRTQGQPTHMVEQMKQHGRDIGLAVVNLIKTTGDWVFIKSGELAELRQKAAVTPQRQVVNQQVLCRLCNNTIIHDFQISTQRPSVHGPHFLEQLKSLNSECPHLPVQQ